MSDKTSYMTGFLSLSKKSLINLEQLDFKISEVFSEGKQTYADNLQTLKKFFACVFSALKALFKRKITELEESTSTSLNTLNAALSYLRKMQATSREMVEDISRNMDKILYNMELIPFKKIMNTYENKNMKAMLVAQKMEDMLRLNVEAKDIIPCYRTHLLEESLEETIQDVLLDIFVENVERKPDEMTALEQQRKLILHSISNKITSALPSAKKQANELLQKIEECVEVCNDFSYPEKRKVKSSSPIRRKSRSPGKIISGIKKTLNSGVKGLERINKHNPFCRSKASRNSSNIIRDISNGAVICQGRPSVSPCLSSRARFNPERASQLRERRRFSDLKSLLMSSRTSRESSRLVTNLAPQKSKLGRGTDKIESYYSSKKRSRDGSINNKKTSKHLMSKIQRITKGMRAIDGKENVFSASNFLTEKLRTRIKTGVIA